MAGRKYGIKKQNNAVKSAQIRSVFIFFSFFHHMRQTFFFCLFLFLTVSSRIRVWGGGEWVREKQRRRRWKIEADGWPVQALVWRVRLQMSLCGFSTPSAPVGRPSSVLCFLLSGWGWSSNPGWWCWPCRLVAPRCAGCSDEECCRQPEHLWENERWLFKDVFTCCKNTKVVFVGKKICSLLVILYGKSVLVSICPTGQLTNPAQNGTNRVLSVSSNQWVVNGPTDQIGWIQTDAGYGQAGWAAWQVRSWQRRQESWF